MTGGDEGGGSTILQYIHGLYGFSRYAKTSLAVYKPREFQYVEFIASICSISPSYHDGYALLQNGVTLKFTLHQGITSPSQALSGHPSIGSKQPSLTLVHDVIH